MYTPNIDDLLKIFKLLIKITDWLAFSLKRRLSAILVFGLIIATLTILFINKSINVEIKENKVSLNAIKLADRKSMYQSTIDWARLCVNSRSKKLKNSNWYCNEAMILFKKNSKRILPNFRDEIINKKAYGAIIPTMEKLDIRAKLHKRFMYKPNKEHQLLMMIFSRTGVVVVSLFIILLMSGFTILLERRSPKKGHT